MFDFDNDPARKAQPTMMESIYALLFSKITILVNNSVILCLGMSTFMNLAIPRVSTDSVGNTLDVLDRRQTSSSASRAATNVASGPGPMARAPRCHVWKPKLVDRKRTKMQVLRSLASSSADIFPSSYRRQSSPNANFDAARCDSSSSVSPPQPTSSSYTQRSNS